MRIPKSLSELMDSMDLVKAWVAAAVTLVIGAIVDAQLALAGSVNSRYSGLASLILWELLPWLLTVGIATYVAGRVHVDATQDRRWLAGVLGIPGLALFVQLVHGPLGGSPWRGTLGMLLAGLIGMIIGWQLVERHRATVHRNRLNTATEDMTPSAE